MRRGGLDILFDEICLIIAPECVPHFLNLGSKDLSAHRGHPQGLKWVVKPARKKNSRVQ